MVAPLLLFNEHVGEVATQPPPAVTHGMKDLSMTLSNQDCKVDNLQHCNHVLSSAGIEALTIFLATARADVDSTDWYSLCTAGQAARAFFKGVRNSSVFRRTACDLVADAYLETASDEEIVVLRPSLVSKIREQASSMRAILPTARYLPSAANTEEFCSGLDSLCDWSLPINAPTSQSGNPVRRAFTLSLARKFADAFANIPVEYIHHLVGIGWPNSSGSATRRVLTSEVTEKIRQESTASCRQESLARGAATLAIQAATSSPRTMSSSDRQTVEQLQREVERVKAGRRRFATDALKLQALSEIAMLFDDPELKFEFTNLINYKLRDFQF